MAGLFNADARVFAPLHKGMAHCVVTDPPYTLTSGGNTGEMKGCFAQDKYDNSGSIVPVHISWAGIMDVCYSLLGEQGHAYVMTNDRHMESAMTAARLAGFRFHNLLVWDKGRVTPNRQYMHQCEYALLLFKGKAFGINNKGDSNVFRVPNNEKDSGHPTQKPVALFRSWIENSTQAGQVVADPFMGSGSAGVAALQSGRGFIGCDIDPAYFAHAEGRITACGRATMGG